MLIRPRNVSQSSEGTPVEVYSYTFTSYEAQRVESSTLSVVYDPQRDVKEGRPWKLPLAVWRKPAFTP